MSDREVNIIISAKNLASKALKDAQKQVKGLGGAMKASSVSVANATVQLAKYTTVMGGVVVAVGNQLANMASDSEESINAVSVVFKDGQDSIISFSKTASKEIGLSANKFRNLSTETGTLLSKIGKPMDQVAESTIELSKRAADLASVYNTDVSLAMSAINQALRGETEALRKYGGEVTEAALQEFAHAEGIMKKVSNMNEAEKVQLRLNKILSDTVVAQGDFLNTADSSANAQRILTAQIEDYSATLGEKFLPYKQKALEVGLEFMKVLDGESSSIGWVNDAVSTAKKVIENFGIAMEYIIPIVQSLWESFVTLYNDYIQPIFKEIGETIDRFSDDWNKNIEDVQENTISVFEGLATFFEGIFLVISNTIQLFLNIIQGDWEEAWDNIQGIFSGVWASISGILEVATALIVNIITGAIGLIKDIWVAGWDWISQKASNIWNSISGGWSRLWSSLSDIFNFGTNALSKGWDNFGSGLKDIMINVWGSIKSTISEGINWVIRNINGLIDSMNAIPGFNIPSIPEVYFANGGVVEGATAFANGGVVSSPQLFGFNKQVGLRGEAGAEAIVPLPDGRSIPVTLKNSSGIIVNVNVSGSIQSENDLATTIKTVIYDALGQQGMRT